jgi:hypothetical protein
MLRACWSRKQTRCWRQKTRFYTRCVSSRLGLVGCLAGLPKRLSHDAVASTDDVPSFTLALDAESKVSSMLETT